MLAFRSPSWDRVVYWAIDLETSGLDPARDLILSVGMVPIRDGGICWGERFYSLIRPQAEHRPADAAIAIHQILPSELDDAPGLASVLPEILRRFNDAVVLVHYAKLDLSFLRGTCRKTGCAWPRPRFVDTVRLLARLGHRRRRLAPHAEALPIDLAGARRALDLPPHVAHHALYDALATAELFLALRSALGVTRLRQLV